MVANNIPQQYIENEWGYLVETFGDATITTSALTIQVIKKGVSVSRLSKSMDKIFWELLFFRST